MIKKKHRKLFFKEDFKKIISKKTRFDNVDDIFTYAEQDDKRNKGVNIDDVEHALSRRRMYAVTKHYTGNARMHVSRAKAYQMHKIAYGKKSKRKNAEYLYQQLKLTNKSTKAVVISNFLSSKSLETIYNIRLKRGRGYSLPPHVKTTMNSVVGEEKHKGIKLRLWNPLRKQRTTIDASKLSTIPGTITDLKLDVNSKIAKKTIWKGHPLTLIEERNIWKNAMNLINKKKIEKSSSLHWTAINTEIQDPISRCMIQKDTPLEEGIRARPGAGWKTVVYQGFKTVVWRGYGQPDFSHNSSSFNRYGNLWRYKKSLAARDIIAEEVDDWMDEPDAEGYDDIKVPLTPISPGEQRMLNEIPVANSKAAWRFYADILEKKITSQFREQIGSPFFFKGIDDIRSITSLAAGWDLLTPGFQKMILENYKAEQKRKRELFFANKNKKKNAKK